MVYTFQALPSLHYIFLHVTSDSSGRIAQGEPGPLGDADASNCEDLEPLWAQGYSPLWATDAATLCTNVLVQADNDALLDQFTFLPYFPSHREGQKN